MSRMSADWVAEQLLPKTHTHSANPVSPEPSSDSTCPSQPTRTAQNACDATDGVAMGSFSAEREETAGGRS